MYIVYLYAFIAIILKYILPIGILSIRSPCLFSVVPTLKNNNFHHFFPVVFTIV